MVGGLSLPGTVIARVVSSRNLSVQYTEGLEYTKVWLRAKDGRAQERDSETQARWLEEGGRKDKLRGCAEGQVREACGKCS